MTKYISAGIHSDPYRLTDRQVKKAATWAMISSLYCFLAPREGRVSDLASWVTLRNFAAPQFNHSLAALFIEMHLVKR